MPNDKKVPATVPTNSTLPQVQSDGLVARGLSAVRQSIAVPDEEDAESLFRKGMRFRNGDDGTPPDSDKARTHLSAAAKLKHAAAQFELWVLLGEYEEWPEAVSWLERSVARGFGPAQRYLADGLSDPLIADHLDKDDYSESQLYRRAVAWYETQASGGDAVSQYDFASWLSHPDCPMHNRIEAMRWMKAAAQQDHGFACMRLGELLLDAIGPEQSTEQGIYWLSRAADLGKSHACRILGDLYLFGSVGGLYGRGRTSQIIMPDNRLAVSWYEREGAGRNRYNRNPAGELARRRPRAQSVMTSHLVEILLSTTAGDGQPVRQGRFEELLQELTERFGGATSFVRLPGKGL